MPDPARLESIDRLRGLVTGLMAVDHAREFFLLHRQVSDPMALPEVPPELFFTRLASHLCAPVFVLLAGLSAWLASQRPGRGQADVTRHLATRGALLIVLEITVVNFAWTFELPPRIVYLQVIWAIGLSMIALSVLRWLPHAAQLVLAATLIVGHHLFDAVHVAPGNTGHVLWSILHDRSLIDLGGGIAARTSYPVLPWIGVILLGHALGPLLYGPDVTRALRGRRLVGMGAGALAGFVMLRLLDVYGDRTWSPGPDALGTVMAFLNVTKYPPSLLFLLLTLGLGLLLLAIFERTTRGRTLAVIGSVPMGFYVVHLYALHLLYLACLAVFGANQGDRFGLTQIWQLWALAALLLLALYPACRAFARIRQASPGGWLRYL